MRPPVEVLLLLCGRGAQERPDDVWKALQMRLAMLLVMNGGVDRQNLLKYDLSVAWSMCHCQ